jgi:hypothetical protein
MSLEYNILLRTYRPIDKHSRFPRVMGKPHLKTITYKIKFGRIYEETLL